MQAGWHTEASHHLPSLTQRHKQQNRQESSSSQSFTTDRRGDFHNLQYGSLEQSKVSRYHTAGFGRLIGLDRRFHISNISGPEREIDDEAVDSSRRRHGSSSLRSRFPIENESVVEIKHNDIDKDFTGQADYVSLDIPRSQQEEIALVPLHDGISLGQQDRSLDKSPNTHPEASNNVFDDFRNNPIHKKNVELSRAVAQNPKDLESWLALIGHQHSLFMLSSYSDLGHLSVRNKQTIAEMKISLFEKALASIHNLSDRKILIRSLMREGKKVWDTDQQMKKWISMLDQTGPTSLWLDFIYFQQTTPVLFSYTKVLDLYAKVLQQAGTSTGDSDHLPRLVLRLTTFMHQAGYTERSIALWQGIIDLKFFTPSSTEPENVLYAYESYWEGEVLRIGEKGGRGWSRSESLNVETMTDQTPAVLAAQEIWNSWSNSELTLSDRQIMPARTMDDTMENDPYRVILFSDIKEYLNPILELRDKELILQKLLAFCGLPPVQKHHSTVTRQPEDAFPSPGLQMNEKLTSTRIITDSSTLMSRFETYFSCFPHKVITVSPLLDFAANILAELTDAFPDSEYVAEYTIALRHAVDPAGARKHAKSLLKRRSDRPRLYNMYALIEARAGKIDVAENIWSTSISMATSFKSHLQGQVSLLWDSWIWELLADNQSDRVRRLLVKVMPLENPDMKLMSITNEPETLQEDDIIQTRQHLSSRITAAIRAHEMDITIAHTNLLAILNYVLSNHDLNEALRTYGSTLASFSMQSNSQICERIHQHRARFIDLHAHCSPRGYRPMQIVTALKESLDLFPDNSIFYNLFETYSHRAGMIDRLRTIDVHLRSELKVSSPAGSSANHNHNNTGANLDDLETNILPTMLKISTELSRPLYSGSTPHSIRAAFSTATSPDNPARHIPSIWLTWIRWEISLLHLSPKPQPQSQSLPQSSFLSTSSLPQTLRSQPQTSVPPLNISEQAARRLRDIYLSSLRACPWVKEVYLLGFTDPTLRHVLGDKALEDIYQSMLDRGLRIRVDIEDLVDERRQRRDMTA